MIPEKVRQEVIRCYAEPQSAWEVATYINFKFFCLSPTKLTRPAVERIWEAEAKVNVVMRQLGDRPVKGFPPSDEVTVARRLLAA